MDKEPRGSGVKKGLLRYLFFSGVFFHILFLVICVFAVKAIFYSGYPLPIYAEKALTNIEVNYPSIDKFARPILSELISWQVNVEYSYTIDPVLWQGVGANTRRVLPPDSQSIIRVHSTETLLQALKNAKAGNAIELLPGIYEIDSPRIHIFSAGTAEKPITVTTSRLGDAKIKLRGEGFVVNKPFWRFQNLHVIGKCKTHSKCEHAFHVVGDGHGAVFMNNILQDFNAAIKINGIGNKFPDNGLITDNTIFNTTVRDTVNPVTPIDLMHANHWRVKKNFIFDFLKGKGNKVSYGAFFKGGSSFGEFSSNLILCQGNLKSNNTAIGLSFGGGGSPENWHRNGNDFEHANGVIQNNIIMNCPNDVGIYVNKSAKSIISNNILYNTLGIDVRFKESSVTVSNNILSGRIKSREGGGISDLGNIVLSRSFFTVSEPLDDIFNAPYNGDFSIRKSLDSFGNQSNSQIKVTDFCDNEVNISYIGAFSGDFCRAKTNLDNPIRVFKNDL